MKPASRFRPGLMVAGMKVTVLLRLRFVMPFMISGALCWIGLHRLLPALKRSGDLTRNLGLLTARLETSEQTVREAEGEGLAFRCQGLRATLAGGESEIGAWLQEVKAVARRFGWELRYEVGEVESHPAGGVEVLRIPVRLALRSASASTNPPGSYRRLLQVGDWIARSPRRADVLEATVKSAGGGMLEAGLAVRMWMIPPSP